MRIKKISQRLLRWFCNPDYLEDIEGDLEELFHAQQTESGKTYAGLYYLGQVIFLFRFALLKKIDFSLLILIDMLKNYLIIGIRNLLKYKSSTAIHVLGLALGLAAFLLINQYTSFEKSYDRFHPGSKDIVRLTTDNILNGQVQVRDAMSFAPSGQVIKDEFSEVLEYTTTYKFSPLVFRKGDQLIEENNFLAVDSNFLKLFGYHLLSGDPASALNDPLSLILSRSQALKYFGSTDVLGRTLEIVSRFATHFKITGVMEDAPENTHYKFNMLMSLSSIKDQIENDDWNGFNYYTYLQIASNTNLPDLQTRLMPMARKYLGEETKLFFNLQPLEDIHLHSDFTFEPEIHGNAKAVKFLELISLFILIIAWVNYINLSTARAVDRAKEVGLRKVIGARRRQLINQFLVESIIVNLISALTALILIKVTLPYFNQFVGKPILLEVFTNSDLWLKLGLFFAVGVVAAGLYPALVLSAFKPIQVVHGKFQSSTTGHLLRRGLVIIQFTASLILIANTAIVYKQVQYMLNQDLGMDISRVIGIKNYQVAQSDRAQFAIDYRTFLSEVARIPGVEGVGAMSNLPGGGSSDVSSASSGVKIVGKTDVVDGTVYLGRINDQIIPTLDIQLLQGRNFDREIASDTQAVIINEALIKKLNLPAGTFLINERFQFGTNPENTKWEIVGVVKDFNRSSLKNSIEPTALFYGEELPHNVVKLSSSDPSGTIAALSNIWYKFFPNAPFTYDFIDQRFEKLYAEDKRFGGLFANFSLLAIIVASLGLFGLSSFLAAKRTKEIGIRKVLGASTANIVFSFFREYLWLISIASLIGIPLIYYAMQEWLHGYAYHITFPWWVLGMAVICIVIFAFLTVGYQNLKVARLNPSDAIRYQ